MSKKILIVEDDKKTAILLRIYLEKDGFNVYISHDGRDGLDQARQTNPDLVVLDLMLPKIDGLDVCRILRAESETPIIMLTALSTEDDILLGLDLGADDYITKPFSPREVVARVRSVLRRSGNDLPKPVDEFKYKELAIDFMGHETRMKGKKINFTPKEFNLLETLVQHPGHTFSRQDLPFIFECFYRADRSRSRTTGGAGLELANVLLLVKAHGGKIRAESKLNNGTRFIFSLPLTK